MLIKTKHNGYAADGTRRYFKGGDGGTYYDQLNRLYGTQADNAEKLSRQSDYTYEDLQALRDQAYGYGSLENQDRAAATARADFQSASDGQLRGITDTLTSMGVDPTDERLTRQLASAGVQNTAGSAAAATGARERVDQQGFARVQDVTSMGLGLPSQATAALNSAGQMASNAGQMQINQNTANQNAIGSAVRGGMDAYRFLTAADGGFIQKFEGGGYVQRLARGGIVGAMQGITPPPPPVGAPPSTPQTLMSSVAPGLMSKGMPQAIGKGIQTVGQAVNSPGMVQFGNGMAIPKGADPSVAEFFNSPDTLAYQMRAANDVNTALGAVETTNTAAGIGTAAEGAAAGTAAAAGGEAAAGAAVAGEAAAGGLGAAGAALGAAMPWIGGAMLLGSALGLFKDGGQVTPGSTHRRGGEVDGPGGPKDDRVPALLSDGEFVLPVGTVKKYGLHKLEKMRQEGLQFEKQLGIGR